MAMEFEFKWNEKFFLGYAGRQAQEKKFTEKKKVKKKLEFHELIKILPTIFLLVFLNFFSLFPLLSLKSNPIV